MNISDEQIKGAIRAAQRGPAMKPGDRIKDNDPRMSGRTLTIVKELHDHIWAKNSIHQEFRIIKRRIYTDDKPRRSGFSLIKEKP